MLAVLRTPIWAAVNTARLAVFVIKTAICAVDIWAMSFTSIALTWAEVRLVSQLFEKPLS